MGSLNEMELIFDLLQEMNQNNVVLYVGRAAEKLSSSVCGLNWRCIVTSQTVADFGKEFSTEQRLPKRYSKLEELPVNIFDRINLPVIQIYGVDGVSEYDVDDSHMEKRLRKKNAEKMMSQIMGRLDVRCKMVVIGYNPNDAEEFPLDDFLPLWYEMQGGSLLFFGMGEEKAQTPEVKEIKKIAEKRGYIWCKSALNELVEIADKPDENAVYEEQQTAEKSLFYKGKQPVTINNSLLLRCRNFAQLLTDETVYRIRPLGRAQQAIWFYNFLNDSSIAPQWYGYLQQSDFSLQRPFEDTLVGLVRNLISGQDLYRPGKVTPVILEGDPGSSKSITLAAVAYRIFNEKFNPVVYIKNDALSFNSSNSQELEQLDELLHEIELAGAKDMRTLILWDSASYRNVSELANNLARQLDNRGRRFVLVCTAYKGAGTGRIENKKAEEKESSETTRWYTYCSGTSFVKGKEGDESKAILFDGKNYYIKATRKLTGPEKFRLKQKAKRYLDVDAQILDRTWKKLEDEGNDDIFIYLYRLVDLIRPNLENRLGIEQRIVSAYVNKQLVVLGAREKAEQDSGNVMLQALLQAGITVDSETAEALKTSKEETEYFDLNKFNICVAMFSRFKLDTPYSLGVHMLYKEKSNKYEEIYNNLELFDIVTKDIPWVYYGEDMSGKFVFRFRNSLEAEIFLDKNAVEAEKQIDIICEMLDYYAGIYKNLGYEDETLMRAIQKMLRMIGPNTDYLPFCQGGTREWQHQVLLKNLDKVIEKLSYMREELKLPDSDASFAAIEITFLREFYGKLWDKLNGGWRDEIVNKKPWEEHPEIYTPENYQKRIYQLQTASNLALLNVDKLEENLRKQQMTTNYSDKKYIVDQINSLYVEISYCNTSLDELLRSYKEICLSYQISENAEMKKIHPLPYLHQYQMLVKAIAASPTNGYAYNALFHLFEKEYIRNTDHPDRQLQLLSEVRIIADDASTLEINNRGMNGRDTLSEYIQKIEQFSSGHRVSIDDILTGGCARTFSALFEKMLENNKAAGIAFVCQQELDNAGLSGKNLAILQEENNGNYILKDHQVSVCHKVLEFMRREEYALCVDKDPYVLYLMLRVAWMCYNRRPMGDGREAQLTYLNHAQWDDIRSICEKYQECAGINKRPMATLLYALSVIQLSGDYIRAIHILDSLREDLFTSPRMRVPYIICEEPGVPKTFSGTVLPQNNQNYNYGGFINVAHVSSKLGGKGIRFILKNLGMSFMPGKNNMLNGLELGLGYTGLAVYTEAGRQSKEGRDE